jgi:methylmalonyl-CoA mutase cobalamin-binding subunit
LYTIRQAAARSGVSPALLRAWERRYGVVVPTRTPSGYRLYDDVAIDRLRTMRRLVDAGWTASTAAASILAGEAPADLGELGGDGRRPGDVPAEDEAVRRGTDGPRPAAELTQRYVRAAARMDPPAVDAALDELFARGSFERTADDLLFPALRSLGDAWASGEVSVAGEHLASAAVHRRLGLALDAAASGNGRGPRVVVGLPPGARHELGALAFAVAARRAGLSVRYVGADLPLEDWLVAAADADAAAIGVVTGRDRRAALDVAQALRAAHPRLVIAFGGAAAPDAPGVLQLPAPLPEAVATLSTALGEARSAGEP